MWSSSTARVTPGATGATSRRLCWPCSSEPGTHAQKTGGEVVDVGLVGLCSMAANPAPHLIREAVGRQLHAGGIAASYPPAEPSTPATNATRARGQYAARAFPAQQIFVPGRYRSEEHTS